MVLLDHGGRDAHELDIVGPPADLSAVIEHLWVQEGGHASASDWRVVPDLSPHLIAVVTARDGTRAMRVALVGARSRAATVDVADRLVTVGLRLRPASLSRLTGASAREFADRSIAIDQVFGPQVLADLELGPDAPSSVIRDALIRLVSRACRQPRAQTMGLGSARGARTVTELASQLSTPTRSLREHAYRDVGLSPKRMLRVLRLHAALHAARRPDRAWSRIAHQAGYADQAHLTRECRALLGEPPSIWAQRGSAVSFKTAGRDAR
jgi:AraC-like DNA-binding protein